MKALFYTGPNSVEYRETAEPQPRDGDVLVEVHAAGICGSDMHAYHGHDPRRVPPLILGHEAAGTCVSGRWAGREVAINPLVSCGVCEFCAEGRPNLCVDKDMVGMNLPGTMASRVAVPERNLFPLPPGVRPEVAALAEPAATALHGLRLVAARHPRPVAESRALVIGAGSVGLLAALILRWWGVSDPAIAELNPLRRQTAQRAGFDRLLDPSSAPPEEGNYHIVVDAVGAPPTRSMALAAVRRGGTVLSLGLQGNGGELDARKLTLEEVVMVGSYTYTPADIRGAIDALGSGRLGRLEWVEMRPLAEGAAAFDDLDNGRTGAAKIMLVP